MISTRPQCAIDFLITASTVSRTRTSHRRPRQFLDDTCVELVDQFCMLSREFSKVRPTAETRSLWVRAALTTERPIWPEAPKTWQENWQSVDCTIAIGMIDARIVYLQSILSALLDSEVPAVQ